MYAIRSYYVEVSTGAEARSCSVVFRDGPTVSIRDTYRWLNNLPGWEGAFGRLRQICPTVSYLAVARNNFV